MLQAFLAVISLSGLTLAAVIAERARLIRREAQREGREQTEKQYRQIVETANEGIWMLDAELTTVFVNRRMAALLGYTAEEMRAPATVWDGRHEKSVRTRPREQR